MKKLFLFICLTLISSIYAKAETIAEYIFDGYFSSKVYNGEENIPVSIKISVENERTWSNKKNVNLHINIINKSNKGRHYLNLYDSYSCEGYNQVTVKHIKEPAITENINIYEQYFIKTNFKNSSEPEDVVISNFLLSKWKLRSIGITFSRNNEIESYIVTFYDPSVWQNICNILEKFKAYGTYVSWLEK